MTRQPSSVPIPAEQVLIEFAEALDAQARGAMPRAVFLPPEVVRRVREFGIPRMASHMGGIHSSLVYEWVLLKRRVPGARLSRLLGALMGMDSLFDPTNLDRPRGMEPEPTGHELLHLRSTQQCATPRCERIPEAKDAFCLECQLVGIPRWAEWVTSSERAAVRPAESAVEVRGGLPSAPDRSVVVEPWQVRVGREGGLTGRVPYLKGRPVQSWSPRVARGLEDLL